MLRNAIVSNANQIENEVPGSSVRPSNFLREVIHASGRIIRRGMFCMGVINPSPCSSA